MRKCRTGILLGFLLVLVAWACADDALSPGWLRARALTRDFRLDPTVALTDSDLIVGWPDTTEVRRISGRYEHSGRVIVVNRGTLILDSADFTLRGDIYVMNNGRLVVRKGQLLILQGFAYQYGGQVSGAGRIEFDSARVSYGGQSWGPALLDSALLAVCGCTLRLGFTTVAMLGQSRADYSGSDFSSEFVVFDSSRLSINRSDTALIWLGFPRGSVVDTRLPGADTVIRHWEFRSGLPGVRGVGYSVTLDTVTGVMWGSFPMKGCSATIRDSRMRSTGVMIPGPDSTYLSGLVNNQQHADYTLPIADRLYRLVNTYLQTWNLYPSDSARFVLESSVFGEMLAMNARTATISNSICDGSGGYIGSEGTAQLIFLLSMIETQVISRDRSVMVGAASTIRFGSVNATDASVMLLMFCQSEFTPRALDTGVVYLSDYTIPVGASVESEFPITGTADLRPGPESPLRFGRYRMSFAAADSPAVFHPIGTTHTAPVFDDTLETWSTHGLEPGVYILKMTLSNSAGDSIEPTKGVYLGYAGLLGHTAESKVPDFELFPNPAQAGAVRLQTNHPGRVCVLDMSGRILKSAICSLKSEMVLSLPSGVYVVRLQAGGRAVSRKLVVGK